MKILFIDRYFYPDRQATSCLLKDLAEYLAKKYTITVICGSPLLSKERLFQKSLLKRERYEDIIVFRIWSLELAKKNRLFRWFNYLSFIINAIFITFFLKSRDLTVVMTSPPLIGVTAYVLKKIKRIPYLYICQDIIPESAIGGGIIGRGGILARFINILNIRLMKNSLKVVALGEKMKQRLIDKGLEINKIEIIPNWTNFSLIKRLSKDNSFSRKYNIYDKFVVLYAGNIGLSHNLEDLIYAAGILREYQDILFVIMGEGVNKKYTVDLAAGLKVTQIIFLPFRDPEMMSEVLASADLCVVMLRKGLSGFVVPSRIYSILASGRGVLGVVEQDSEIAQIIKEANCGEVVEPGNPKLLSEVIVSLYKNRVLLKQYADNALNYARENNFKQSSLIKYDILMNNLMR